MSNDITSLNDLPSNQSISSINGIDLQSLLKFAATCLCTHPMWDTSELDSFNSSPQIMTVLTNKISAFREKKKQLYPFTCKFEIIMYSDPCVHKDHNHMTLTSQATESRFDSPPEMPFFMPALPICVSAHLLRPICTSKCFHYQTNFFSTVQFILATRQIFFSGLALFSKQAVTTSFGFAFLMVSDFEIQIKYKEN